MPSSRSYRSSRSRHERHDRLCRMVLQKQRHGPARDAILEYFKRHKEGTPVEITDAAKTRTGQDIPRSSIRSYLNLNTGTIFERVQWGRYKLKK